MITISNESDWREATNPARALTLTVVESADDFFVIPTALSSAPATATATATPTPAAEPAQTVPADALPLLSFAADATPDATPADNAEPDVPLNERLEALLVEALFSGEKFIDELLTTLKHETANTELPPISQLLEDFFLPLKDACRTGSTKACELLASLQEHAQSSLLLARIASVLSLATEALANAKADVSATACAAPINIENHIRTFVAKIQAHPDVQTLINTIKEKLAAKNNAPAAAAAATASPTTPPEVVAATFVADVTIPDDSELLVHESPVVKTWRVRNSGNVSWPADIALVSDDGKERIIVSSRPMPDTEIDISVTFTPTAGASSHFYSLVDASGKLLLRLWVRYNGLEYPSAWEPTLELLQQMGFARDNTLAALVAAKGNAERAVELLMQ